MTIGTGHASLGQNAVNAAAHYDNTGTVVASVRAGEDKHGIWLAGRLVPGTPPERVDELRRSGVSGDWRGINGQMELVAAVDENAFLLREGQYARITLGRNETLTYALADGEIDGSIYITES